MARRFRLSFVRPAVQSKLDPRVKAAITAGWDDEACVFDMRLAFEEKEGVLLLAAEVGRLVFEGGGGAFIHLAKGLKKAAESSIIDWIATLDEKHPTKVYEIRSSSTPTKTDAMARLAKIRQKVNKRRGDGQ